MRWIRRALVASLLLGVAASAPDEKRLSIYSAHAGYSLGVSERGGHDYVGLLEILEPLGAVSARSDGKKWKLRFNNVEAEFKPGNSRVKIRGREFDLSGKFLLESGRGLVPLDSIVTLLPRFLGFPVLFHQTARRLFVDHPGITYTAELNKAAPQLVLTFSQPVNPTIATEPGKLNMLFVRDPVVPSGAQTTNFDTKTISAATFLEENGAAEITVTGGAPLLASFSNNGRTITIAPAPSASSVPAQTPSTAQPGASPVSGQTSQQVPSPPIPARRIFAVIDASHGGDEAGATLADRLLEKDVTIAFARRIRDELLSRGLPTMILRDGDFTLTLDQRATAANIAHPSIYLSVHAATSGTGVRVYTALMPATTENRGPFVAWESAQAASLGLSQTIAAAIATELRKKVAARTLAAPLRPLNNVIAPALAIEVASQTGDIADLTSVPYQQMVATSVANIIISVRDKLEAAR